MSVKLRLRRIGTNGKPAYRIVAADTRSPRDGRFIEILGHYDPRHQDEKVDLERVDHWLKNGAQPSETVADIIKRAREGKSFTPPAKTPKPDFHGVVGTGLVTTPPKREADESRGRENRGRRRTKPAEEEA